MQKVEIIGNYKVIQKIGSGSFGEVFLAEDRNNRSQVAIKKELIKTGQPLLLFESKVLKSLRGGSGIPHFRWYGTTATHNILIMDLLGPSIEFLFQYCNRKFSLKTVLMVSDQLISVIEFLHSKHFIHRDMKPDNILFGLGTSRNKLHLIDFGLSKKYRSSHNNQHIPFRSGKPMLGTARYCSINAHCDSELSRRDDMESVGYIMIYFLRRILPWQNMKASKADKNRMIGEKKRATCEEELCQGFPVEFATYLKMVKALAFDEQPQYDVYRKMFRLLFENSGYKIDDEYDWVLLNNKQRTN